MVTPCISHLFACLARDVWLDSGYIKTSVYRSFRGAASGKCRCIQRLAWSVCGYMPIRQFTRHLVWCFFCGPLYLAVHCWMQSVPEECSYAVFLGDHFRICRIQLFTWFDSGYIFMSVYGGLGGFHALREGGPWILILRSIPSCPGGSWTNFTYFHCEGGHASEVDSGYTFMRQSTVAFGKISHISR